MGNDDEFPDCLIFLDEEGNKKSIFVKILDTSNLIKFRTKDGNVICLPTTSVVKIKLRGEQLE